MQIESPASFPSSTDHTHDHRESHLLPRSGVELLRDAGTPEQQSGLLNFRS